MMHQAPMVETASKYTISNVPRELPDQLFWAPLHRHHHPSVHHKDIIRFSWDGLIDPHTFWMLLASSIEPHRMRVHISSGVCMLGHARDIGWWPIDAD